MKHIKSLAAFALVAGMATAASAAEAPASSLQQLDAFVTAMRPLSPVDSRGGTATADTFNYVRVAAADAYARGNVQEGCHLENFARHIVGQTQNPACAEVAQAKQ